MQQNSCYRSGNQVSLGARFIVIPIRKQRSAELLRLQSPLSRNCAGLLIGALRLLLAPEICRSLPEAYLPTVPLFAATHADRRVSCDEDPDHGLHVAEALDMLPGDRACDLNPYGAEYLSQRPAGIMQ